MDPKQNAQGFHLRNIGRLIEQNENDVRQEMSGIYINKSKQIIYTGRLREDYDAGNKAALRNELMQAMMKQN